MAKNGTIAKWIIVGIAVAGIIWNAATLHNDVGHFKTEFAEYKKQTTERFEKLETKVEKIYTFLIEKENP